MSFVEVTAPVEQEGTKAVVRGWLAKVGQAVRENDPLVELETDKVTMEVSAPADGILHEILVESGAEAPAGLLLARLRLASDAADVPATQAPAASAPAAPTLGRSDPELRLSPAVRRALATHKLDPREIAGTGRGGRLTRADVDAWAARPVRTPAAPRSPAAPAGAPRSRLVPHDSMRRRIAERMVQSVTDAPHVTAVFEADFSQVAAHRSANKAAYERDGIGLTYTAYIVAACAKAMAVAPAVNARWHDEHLELFDDINIGVGTALGDKGLIVPVVHGVQDLSLREIAARLQDLIGRARENKLAPGDVAGGTFTISNHGVSGSLLAAPVIINQPQSAILGVGKLEKRVVVRSVGGVDSLQVRPMAYVSLTIDHRVLDGHQTNAWLTRFVEVIESWPADSD